MPRVLVDSRFRLTGTQEDYTFRLFTPAKNIRFVKLLEATVPRSTYPITTGYNDVIEYNDGSAKTMTITQGNYTLDELAALLSTGLSETVTVNPNTGKFEIASVSSLTSFGPFLTTPAAHHVLGVPIDGVTGISGSWAATYPALLNWPDYLKLNLTINQNNGASLYCAGDAHTFVVPMRDTMWGEYANWSTGERYQQIDNVADKDQTEIRITWYPPDEVVSYSDTAVTNWNNSRQYFSFNGIDHQLLFDFIE
jgi:hypothetical protein